MSYKVILQMIINSNDPGDMIPLRYLPESKSVNIKDPNIIKNLPKRKEG